jgi:hypothetical protein
VQQGWGKNKEEKGIKLLEFGEEGEMGDARDL